MCEGDECTGHRAGPATVDPDKVTRLVTKLERARVHAARDNVAFVGVLSARSCGTRSSSLVESLIDESGAGRAAGSHVVLSFISLLEIDS